MTDRFEPDDKAPPAGVERIFLGWDEPLLVSAARWLLAEGVDSEGLADLGALAVVVPGRRAARRLLERLVDINRPRGPGLVPPQILTLGALPEQLYRPQLPVAGELEAKLVRLAALLEAPAELVAQLFPGGISGDDGLDAVAELERLDDELAAEGRDLSDVRRAGAELDLFTDFARWQALEQLRDGFERRLRRSGRQSRTVARWRALGSGALEAPWERIVLVGLIDLPRLFRRLLEGSGVAATALVQAPEELEDSFDPWGCPLVSAWQERTLDLDGSPGDVEIEVVLRPCDQVRRATARVKQWCEEEGYEPEEIATGFGDPRLSRPLLEGLELIDVEAHSPFGRSLDSTSPVQALTRLARFLASRRLRDLASALRVPVVEDWLRRQLDSQTIGEDPQGSRGVQSDWLAALDRYLAERPVVRLEEGAAESAALVRVVAAMDELFAPLDGRARRSLREWSPIVARALERLFPDPLDPSRWDHAEEIEVLERLGEVLSQAHELPVAVAPEEIDLARALHILLRGLAEEPLPEGAAGHGVELLGWLELALDDAPATVVVGLNEGTIPARVLGDAFLPDSLRQVLGLVDQRRRYARDLFLLSGLCSSRERLLLVCGRESADGEPLAPSRLLLARSPGQLAGAVLALYSSAEVGSREVPWEHAERSAFQLPPPQPLKHPIERLRATAFGDYLSCPYRFYLRHVLRLEAVGDQARELDARAFGVMAHEVLHRFALGPAAASEDPEAIARELRRLLREAAAERLGARPLPAVRVQLAQLSKRLQVFAHWQARQRRDGWQIDPQLVERRLETTLDVDGQAFGISGIIDRVDVHPRFGLRVIDYKTGDVPRGPEETHGPHRSPDSDPDSDANEWRDLQLPLYRQLMADLADGRAVEMAYVCLSKRLSAELYRPADWKPADYQSALATAAEVVRALRQERFWPPAAPPRYDDGLARLCGDSLPESLRHGWADGTGNEAGAVASPAETSGRIGEV